jgi:hypothetical protein
MFLVIPQSGTSYRCNDHIYMAVWLTEQGYKTEDARSKYEYLRLRKGSSLIVLYYSGTVLLQGGDLEAPRDLIQTLTQPVEDTADLPF